MSGKGSNLFRAFIAGTVVPTILVPIGICFAIFYERSELLAVPFIHWLPVIWGIWNLLYAANLCTCLPKNLTLRLFVVGAVLGLLLALYGIFWQDIPSLLDIPEAYRYYPLFVIPILYAILWRWAVHPINKLLSV